jgi:transglutaminase superfamily protein
MLHVPPVAPGRLASRASRRGRATGGAGHPWRRALWATAFLAIGASAGAEPVLHEFIELGPGDGPVEPALTGRLGAPPPSSGEPSPGGSGDTAAPGGGVAGAESTYSIDRDTSRPQSVSYADPFTPTVVPFKRSIVYDAVNAQGDLLVRDHALSDVPTLTGPRASDESFHASFELDLMASERTPLPSVAPGARLVLVNREPRVPLRIGMDSAENWVVTSPVSRHVRLTLQIVADRRVFGSAYPDVSATGLAPALPALPGEVQQSALDVARTLGIDPRARPQQMVAALVAHFRRFSASERRPTSQGLALYRELALTARGICRHRSYAFMLTALGLGIPTRVAMNEAHAWVEVFDGELWHRIDLGGAADHLEMDDQGRPRHVEPHDPFSWPDRRESGLAMADRPATTPGSSGAAAASPPAPSAAGGPSQPGNEPTSERAGALAAQPPAEDDDDGSADAPAGPEPPPSGAAPSPLPEEAQPLVGEVHLRPIAARAERGKSLFVSGNVQNGSGACSGARVDVALSRDGAPPLPLGSLVSDGRGEFRGSLVIPWNAVLGDHALVATATGCAARPGVR